MTCFLASVASYPKAIVHTSTYPLLQLQPILLICGFYICKFAYSVKFIGNPQINTRGALLAIASMCMYRMAKNSICPTCSRPSRSQTGWLLVSASLNGLLGATFSALPHISWVISLFQTAPMCSADVLACDPRFKKAVVCRRRHCEF